MDDYSFSFDGDVESSRMRKTSNFNLMQVVDDIKSNEDSKKGKDDSNNNTSFGGKQFILENNKENENLSFTKSPNKNNNDIHELSFNDI